MVDKTLITFLLICLPFTAGCNKLIKQITKGSPGVSLGVPTLKDPVNTCTPPPPPGAEEVWLLMGQSNMSGEAGGTFPAMPGITYLYGTPRGLGYAFGMERVRLGHPVTLIQCGASGSKMNTWTVGGGNYDICLSNARNSGLQITGAVFSQGENDATDPIAVPWRQMFETMVRGLQSEFGSHFNVVYLETGDLVGDPGLWLPVNLGHVRREQRAVNTPGAVFVGYGGIQPTCGGWHYCTTEMITLARRMSQSLEECGE